MLLVFNHLILQLFSKTVEYQEKIFEEIEQQPKKIYLNVGIIEAKDLLNKSSKELIDPYCYIYLTKNNNGKESLKSKHRKTLSCDFHVEKDKCKLVELQQASLPPLEKNSSPKFSILNYEILMVQNLYFLFQKFAEGQLVALHLIIR